MFAPDGSPAARVELPPHRKLLDVAHGAVVLLESGPYDENIVGVYSLVRN